MPESIYTIGALARAAGVPVSTVRFYERRGILRPEGRSRANYRRYSDDSLQKLRLIRCAQGIGLSLRDARELLGLVDTERCPCNDVEQVVRRRLDEVRVKIRELRRCERALERSLRVCCRGKRARARRSCGSAAARAALPWNSARRALDLTPRFNL